MMIEMRWLKVSFNERPPPHAIPIGGQLATEYRVLQYREAPTGEHFSAPPSYKWMDVKLTTQP